MGKQIPISTSFNLPDGREVTIETGKLATQAHGSVVVRVGDTMLMAVATSAAEAREGQSFFPLSVDYQEKFAAAGRIPGNFFRREARLNDYEILTSRLVDRAIRPLFPDGYMNDTQIILNLISADIDRDVLPDAYAALAASAALTISDIPWAGPISEVRVARINGEFVINPGRAAVEEADLEIIVAATLDDVTMVEGEMKEVSESVLVDAIRFGHEAIKVQCNAQLELVKAMGLEDGYKREFAGLPEDLEIKKIVEEGAVPGMLEVARGAHNKVDRKNGFKKVKEEFKAKLLEDKGEEWMAENKEMVSFYFDKLKKHTIREMVLSENTRLDGRKYDEVRHIWTEVDYLPSTHGSAIFNRGETQALASVTLGTKNDELMNDIALHNHSTDFILHYNFPGYSVGEVKPMRGPGRREVGHANLAARSIKQTLPEENPYTLRIVSDILESNGSSSMATVCAGSLALMDAGIKVSGPVAGIAMGMISDGDRVAILSDILGDEDAIGDMDFKLTGTDKGICACQMDIKIDGLPYDLLEKALQQANEGRLHILGKMKESLEAPREDLKPHAPRVHEMIIAKSFIGAVIGPGGSIIQELQKDTNTVINITEEGEKGIVNISSSNKEDIEKAIARVKAITHQPEVGDVYDAKVASVMPYGVFVDFAGKSGLLHVSEISHSRIENVSEVFSQGDEVKVKLIGIDKKTGKFRLSRKALIQRPERGGNRNGDRRPRQDRDN